jgi:hypothetical protein
LEICLFKFKKNDHVVTEIKFVGNVTTQPHCIAEAFADHFSPIFNSPSFVVIPNNAHFTFFNFLNISSISDSDVMLAIRCLSQTKRVDPDEILSSIIFLVTFLILLLHSTLQSLMEVYSSVFTLVQRVSTTLGHHQVPLLLLLKLSHCNFAFIYFYVPFFICLMHCLTFYFQHTFTFSCLTI